MSKDKKTKEKVAPDTPSGAVIYTDGGCRPSKGFGGWGFHGYVYSDQIATKGSGNSRQYVTVNGYVPRSDFTGDRVAVPPKEVKTMYYLEGHGSFDKEVTNNIAEITAATRAIDYVSKYDLKDVLLMTDSEQVIKASNDWINIWKSNDWIKSDGSPVANKEYWQALDNNLSKLKEQGTNIQLKWIKGHSDHDGNERADQLATMGVLNSIDGVYKTDITQTKADGYWKRAHERNHFITHKCIYFISRDQTIVPGEYYMGNHGREDELLAKRTADGCYAYVRVKEPDPVIEMARKKQVKVANGNEHIFILKLQKLLSREVYNDMMLYGETCLFTRGNNPNSKGYLNLYYLDKEVVTEQLSPPLIAIRAIESVNVLKGLLLAWEQSDDVNVVSTDITDVFYETGKKGEQILKKELVSGVDSVRVNVNNFTSGSEELEFVFGVDCPHRNTLKRVENKSTKVYAVTWRESPTAYRYATIVKTADDIGIWAGMYSNMRILSNVF